MAHMTATALPTRYAGCHFRSRLEARWAVFFDHLDIRWEYEPEGFVGCNNEPYLPDFRLPDVHHRFGELPIRTVDDVELKRHPWLAGLTLYDDNVGIYVEVKGSDDALRADGQRIGATIDYNATPIGQAGLLILGDVPRGEAWSTMHSFLYWHKGVAHTLVRFQYFNHLVLQRVRHPFTDFSDDVTSEDVTPETSTMAVEIDGPRLQRGSMSYWWDKEPFQTKVDQAYKAARSARFEHGENGST